MEIKKFSPENHHVKAVVYGGSGTGKTTFAGTAKDAIFASAEGGLLSIANKNPNYVDITSLQDLRDLLVYLKTEKHNYKTVIIDSITEINEIIKVEIEKKNGRAMIIADWGTLSKDIRALLRAFRALPMHVLFIAQEIQEKDEDRVTKITPSLNGKAATDIAYFMDVVGYLYIEKDGSRTMITSPNAKLLTKDRTNKITNETPVDFQAWIDLVGTIETKKEETVVEFKTAEPAPTPSPKK